MSDPVFVAMSGTAIGSANRDVREPSGTTLHFKPDDGEIIGFDVIDLTLPDLSATSYSTVLLAQQKWATQGISRIIEGGQITATIECPTPVYTELMEHIGEHGIARIEARPFMEWLQYRVAIMTTPGGTYTNGDRVTGTLTLTVTNSSADGKSEIGPMWGALAA
ncbi:MAG: hypothetical protein FWH21_00520 [Kiritimatiellaeota bacterium]|nr:hypothetical protein [Kiritimatiellota bacterium]